MKQIAVGVFKVEHASATTSRPTASVNFTPRVSSIVRAVSIESTRTARCRQPASLLSAVSFNEEAA